MVELLRNHGPLLFATAVAGGLAAAGHAFDSCVNPPPVRLVGEIRRGMRLDEIEARSQRLGFEWRVRDAGGKRHIICHLADERWACENFEDVTSFGVLFQSHACNITLEAGVVDQLWFYMD